MKFLSYAKRYVICPDPSSLVSVIERSLGIRLGLKQIYISVMRLSTSLPHFWKCPLEIDSA